MLVGVTGPSGAGKSCVVEEFARLGFCVIDADAVAREVVMPGEPVLERLAAEFGDDIIAPDGTLERRLLAARAFASEEKTIRLNGIMHSSIVERMIRRADICAAEGKNSLFDAPLLIEAGLDVMCDVCVAVIAPEETRIERLMKRDRLPREELLRRLRRQHDDGYYTSRCGYVICNDGDLAGLRLEAARIAREIIYKTDNKEI